MELSKFTQDMIKINQRPWYRVNLKSGGGYSGQFTDYQSAYEGLVNSQIDDVIEESFHEVTNADELETLLNEIRNKICGE